MILHTVRHSLYSTPDGSLTSTYITHGIKWYRMYHDMEHLLCIYKRWKWYVCIWTVQLPELILFVTSDNLQSLLLYMSAPLLKLADSIYHYHYSGYFLWFAISNVAGAWPTPSILQIPRPFSWRHVQKCLGMGAVIKFNYFSFHPDARKLRLLSYQTWPVTKPVLVQNRFCSSYRGCKTGIIPKRVNTKPA